jgi:(p)ppGpp synthase/HD superfamily hydrolase
MKSQMIIAIDLATKWHEGQRYGKLPYIAHLMDVDRWVIERNVTVKDYSDPYSEAYADRVDQLRAIAYLHDILEDTECTAMDLRNAGICEDVVNAVVLLTKKIGEEYKEYLEKIIQNTLAREVKICDTMANLTQSVKKNNTKRIAKYTRQLAILAKGEYFE